MSRVEEPSGVRKGAWSKEEDDLLRACIHQYGEGKWHLVPQRAGLKRCRKSCRLRWLNYLKPSIKRGEFGEDEIDMIIRFHKLLGNRWTLIAGRLPGRTANDVKNFWNTNIRHKVISSDKKEDKMGKAKDKNMKPHVLIKPQPLTFSKNSVWLKLRQKQTLFASANDVIDNGKECEPQAQTCPAMPQESENSTEWFKSLQDCNEGNRSGCFDETETEKPEAEAAGPSFLESAVWNDFPLETNLWDSLF